VEKLVSLQKVIICFRGARIINRVKLNNVLEKEFRVSKAILTQINFTISIKQLASKLCQVSHKNKQFHSFRVLVR
jgi:hypothetical protein